MAYSFREIQSLLEKDGWFLVRQKGSHRQFKHPSKNGITTLSYHRAGDVPKKGTLASIEEQTGVKLRPK